MGGRIGKVRMKATGFEFRVIPGPPEPENDMGATMMRHARSISQTPGLAGTLVIGLTGDGGFQCGFRWDETASPVPRTLMPSYIAEVLRRELITDISAEQVFHENLQWVE